jgi:hypothetical protein
MMNIREEILHRVQNDRVEGAIFGIIHHSGVDISTNKYEKAGVEEGAILLINKPLLRWRRGKGMRRSAPIIICHSIYHMIGGTTRNTCFVLPLKDSQ